MISAPPNPPSDLGVSVKAFTVIFGIVWVERAPKQTPVDFLGWQAETNPILHGSCEFSSALRLLSSPFVVARGEYSAAGRSAQRLNQHPVKEEVTPGAKLFDADGHAFMPHFGLSAIGA